MGIESGALPKPILQPADDFPQNPQVVAATKIVERLQQAGHTAYFAGGAVRDKELGLVPKDVDVATSAHPNEVRKIFRKTMKVGIAFGVVLVLDFGESVEVATFREDGNYSDGRRPDEVRFSDAEHDALRRDFTVNALFYDPATKTILDYTGGIADIQQKTLRAVGDPELRFAEDYLRMLRAVRFSCVLGFRIEENTLRAIRDNADKLRDISLDRVHVELRKSFLPHSTQGTLNTLAETGLQSRILPDSPKAPHETVKEGKAGFNPALAFLLSNTPGNKIQEEMSRLRLSNEEKREVGELLKSLADLMRYDKLERKSRLRALRRVNPDEAIFLLGLHNANRSVLSEIKGDLCQYKKDHFWPEIPGGNDLIKAGFKPGKLMGEAIHYLEDLALSGENVTGKPGIEKLKSHPKFAQAFQNKC